MTTLTIEQKQSNSGSIHDLASQHYDRVVEFGESYQFAVILPAHYGDISSRHKTIEAAMRKAKSLNDYEGVRIIDRDGCEWSFDGHEARQLANESIWKINQ